MIAERHYHPTNRASADNPFPTEKLEQLYGLGEQIKLAIIEGNLERAKDLVDRGPAVLNPEPEYDPGDPESAPLTALIADTKLCNSVSEGSGAQDAGDFCRLTEPELKSLPNVGKKGLAILLAIQSEWREKIRDAESKLTR